jgi:hypothetical protein
MPYITREDGERFIIPSYRDTLSAKKTSLLKKEVELLSANYGEYITLQKKNLNQYEIAFSPDAGYLLGECVWQYFKRPYDMIYCEAIPNTGEAILVIVKSGSVYLDGSFSLDSIPEELVIFKTQQNNFSIFIYGDVPISEHPEDGKFTFDASSVRSFSVLPDPVFPTLPGVKAFQLQLVDTVLKSYGIGVLPIKGLAIFILVTFALYFIYDYLSTHKKALPIVIVGQVNPYQGYIDQLTTPDPSKEIENIYNTINFLYTIPGWFPDSLDYTPGYPAKMRVHIRSHGARTSVLLDWAKKNNLQVDILPDGFYITILSLTPRRQVPTTINRMQDIIANLLDRLSYVIPGNSLGYGAVADKRSYVETTFTINFSNASPFIFDLIGRSIGNLPLTLIKTSIKIDETGLSGTITFKALGN